MIAVAFFALAAACLEPSARNIRAGDVAAAVPAFGQLPPETVLSFSPQPGYTRVFLPGELMQWLSRHEVKAEAPEPVCFAWTLRQPDAASVKAAMLKALPADSDLDIVEMSQYGVPEGDLDFPPAGLRTSRPSESQVWKGFVTYGGGLKYEVWARVNLRVPYQRVIALRDIKPGSAIDESAVRLDSGKGPLSAADEARELTQVTGRTVRRLIRSGAPISLVALDKVRAIQKGDPVQVRVISGAAQLAFDGVAEGAAAVGDPVAIRNEGTGKVVRARALGTGQALLDVYSRK